MCPCGARGDPAVECGCTPQRLAAYREKLSRALLDRFDLAVAMPRPRACRARRAAGRSRRGAFERACSRRASGSGPPFRGEPTRRPSSSRTQSSGLPLSGRGRVRVARVARTIAALAGSTVVGARPSCRGALVPHAGRAAARDGDVRLISAAARPAFPRSPRRDPRPAAAALSPWRRPRSELLPRPTVAIVGARACSAYGRSVARSLARELAAGGLVVVSGMARGIDGEAHRGALEAGGRTVAVLGCGIDRDYPAAHAELARRICERGLVVSEYEPGVEPAPWRFPAS